MKHKGKTQQKIADEKGVSQQAVSKTILDVESKLADYGSRVEEDTFDEAIDRTCGAEQQPEYDGACHNRRYHRHEVDQPIHPNHANGLV